MKPFTHRTCWQSGSMFIFQQSALAHCVWAQPPRPVWCVRSTQAFLSLRSTLIPGEHVCWNSPPIKTGISQVRCGNRPSVGKQRVCLCSLLPSPTLSLILARSCSWSYLPPVFLTLTVPLPPSFSHPIFLNFLILKLSVFLFRALFNPGFIKSMSCCFPYHLFLKLCTLTHFIFPSFYPLFPLFLSHPESPQPSVLILQGFLKCMARLGSPLPPLLSSLLMPLQPCAEGLSGGELGTLAWIAWDCQTEGGGWKDSSSEKKRQVSPKRDSYKTLILLFLDLANKWNAKIAQNRTDHLCITHKVCKVPSSSSGENSGNSL